MPLTHCLQSGGRLTEINASSALMIRPVIWWSFSQSNFHVCYNRVEPRRDLSCLSSPSHITPTLFTCVCGGWLELSATLCPFCCSCTKPYFWLNASSLLSGSFSDLENLLRNTSELWNTSYRSTCWRLFLDQLTSKLSRRHMGHPTSRSYRPTSWKKLPRLTRWSSLELSKSEAWFRISNTTGQIHTERLNFI